MGVALRGDASSGRTTLALRLAAEAQAAGSIVAWLDLAAALDPVEAVARGVEPEWLVVADPGRSRGGPGDRRLAARGSGGGPAGHRPAGELRRWPGASAARARDSPIDSAGWPRSRAGPGSRSSCSSRRGSPGRRRARGRRRRGDRHPAGAGPSIVDPARPGRRRPANGGDRRPQPGRPTGPPSDAPDPLRRRRRARRLPPPRPSSSCDARPVEPAGRPSTSPPSSQCPGTGTMRLLHLHRPHLLLDLARRRLPSGSWPAGAGRPRRPAVVERDRPRRGPRRAGARRPARDAARVGPPAGAGGDLPRRRAGG